MTRRKKLMSLFIALIIVLGAVLVFPLTASAANNPVTIGSGLFTSSNTKNMTIKGTDDGIALRVDQKEFAYTEWTATLPMNNFSMDFKIIDDNFETLVLTFTSMYDESVSNNYDHAISARNSISDTSTDEEIEASTEAVKAVIQPEKIKNVITLTKESGEIKVQINESTKTKIGSEFKNLELTVSYNEGDFTVKNRGASGETKTVAATNGTIINNEANLRIDFPKDSITKVRKDVTDDKGETTYGASTLLIEKMSYKNINSSEQQEQSLKGATVTDTSKPVLKSDGRLLKSDKVYVPLNTQYKIPVYGIDIIKYSTLSLSATVKFYKDENDKNPETVTVRDMAFQVDTKEGYYSIEKITINDTNNSVTFGKDDPIKDIDGITFPITVKGVENTNNSNNNLSFNFNIGSDYAKLFEGIELKGGSKNKVTFPAPIVGTANFANEDKTGVRSLIENEKGIHEIDGTKYDTENRYNITYKLWYQHQDSDSWTENSSFGLDFTATKTGTYKFKIEAYDRQGHKFLCETIIILEFIDTEAPEITVNSFPDEITVNEKFTIPTASVSDDFNNSPSKTIALYSLKEDGSFYLNADGSYDESKRIELKDGSFTPDDDMLNKMFGVVYNASDLASPVPHLAITVERTFKVVKVKPSPKQFFEMNTLSIIFLCLGGASLLGIMALLFIKPKEKQ